MAKEQLPPCPRCKSNKQVNRHGREEFFCGKCSGIFDGDPDEGGTHSNKPSGRLEREERRKDQRR